MQLLILPAPGKKFSMSFRDSYPYERNQDQVWLIADLKAYLSAELSEERFEEIGVVFSSLHELINNIIRNVEKILVGAYRSSYTPMMSAYGALIKVVEGYPIQHEPQDVPLDEELFIHLHTLEFSHFAAGYQKLLSEAIPQCTVTPVFEELRALAKEAFPTLSEEVNEYDPLISIGEVPAFTHRWQNKIAGIIEKAMGVSLTSRNLNKITADVQNSLRNFYYFRNTGEGTLQEETRQVSPGLSLLPVVAFCIRTSLPRISSPTGWVNLLRAGVSIPRTRPHYLMPISQSIMFQKNIATSGRIAWNGSPLRFVGIQN